MVHESLLIPLQVHNPKVLGGKHEPLDNREISFLLRSTSLTYRYPKWLNLRPTRSKITCNSDMSTILLAGQGIVGLHKGHMRRDYWHCTFTHWASSNLVITGRDLLVLGLNTLA